MSVPAISRLGLDDATVDVLSESNNGGACALSVQSLVVVLEDIRAAYTGKPIPIVRVVENGSDIAHLEKLPYNGIKDRLLRRKTFKTVRETPDFFPLAAPIAVEKTGIEAQFGFADNCIGVRLANGTFIPLIRLVTREQNTINGCPAIWISSNVRSCLKSEIDSVIVIDNDASKIVHAQVLPSQANPSGLELVASKDLVDELLEALNPETKKEVRETSLADVFRHLDVAGALVEQLGIDLSRDYSDEVQFRAWLDAVAGNKKPVDIGSFATARANRPAMLTEQRFSVVRDGDGGFVIREVLHQPNAADGKDLLALEINIGQGFGRISATSPAHIHDVDSWGLDDLVAYVEQIVNNASIVFPETKKITDRYDGEYHTPGDVVVGEGVHFFGDITCTNLTLSKDAYVYGRVEARGQVKMEQNSTIEGTLVSYENVHIAQATVLGDLRARTNVVAEGIRHSDGKIVAGGSVKLSDPDRNSFTGPIEAHDCWLTNIKTYGDVVVTGDFTAHAKHTSNKGAYMEVHGSVTAGRRITARANNPNFLCKITGKATAPEFVGKDELIAGSLTYSPVVKPAEALAAPRSM